ncbi:hypothetical protein [Methylobacterium indicum]|uniref:Phasin domain-containing protein n=1 Tax=Methylobacterium indicum TaxID=1775910 RepID=A0A8H8WQS5_9HYPH|nr:hypothetical protein [Methylobacterium indicum]BCM82645.1 hypothetical protein mvi_11060 [Methylobacterium indicum]
MTTRRIDKTRKPPRRPPVRTAARPNGASQSVQGETGLAGTDETAPDTAAETVAVAPPATPDAAEVVAPEPAAPDSVAEQEPAAQPADAVSEETGAAASESPVEPAEASAAAADEAPAEVPAAQEPTAHSAEAHDAEAHDAEAHDAEAHDAAAQEPATQEPEPVAPQGSDEATARPQTVSSDPAPADVPAVASAAGPAPAASPDTASAASPDTASAAGASKPSGAEQEVPLAALQGFIEINGRLVAFLQGEGQAAVAFWKSAMTVRSPGDLAQLQAAEMSRAIDAAFACWTDLARRMGRLATVVPSRSRAA